MAAIKHITTGQLEGALKANHGVLTFAAEALGTSVQNISQRVKASAHLQKVLEDIENKVADIAERGVLILMAGETDPRTGAIITKPDGATCRWYLERKGRKRGYGNQVDLAFTQETADAIAASIAKSVDGDLDKLRAVRALLAGETET